MASGVLVLREIPGIPDSRFFLRLLSTKITLIIKYLKFSQQHVLEPVCSEVSERLKYAGPKCEMGFGA